MKTQAHRAARPSPKIDHRAPGRPSHGCWWCRTTREFCMFAADHRGRLVLRHYDRAPPPSLDEIGRWSRFGEGGSLKPRGAQPVERIPRSRSRRDRDGALTWKWPATQRAQGSGGS